MKILHFCSLDKFIPPFINNIKENFEQSEHLFWLFGDIDTYSVDIDSNVKYGGRKLSTKIWALFYFMKDLHCVDKIVLHSFTSTKIALILFFMPWLSKKCYWFIWGGDLYGFKTEKRNLKWYTKELFRRPVIRRMANLVTYLKGDYNLAREWYGCTGMWHECIMYTSNTYKELPIGIIDTPSVNILLGNSADPTNNHIDALQKISAYKDEKIEVIAPLSYGKKEYSSYVIREGERILGDKFRAITDFLPFPRYLELLSSINMAVFNHDRQQAMGNTILLLGLKKTVYIKRGTSQWELFEQKQIKILDVDDFSLKEITDQDKEKNKEIIRGYFSIENLNKQLDGIFKY